MVLRDLDGQCIVCPLEPSLAIALISDYHTALCRTIGQGTQNYSQPNLIRDNLGVSACAISLLLKVIIPSLDFDVDEYLVLVGL